MRLTPGTFPSFFERMEIGDRAAFPQFFPPIFRADLCRRLGRIAEARASYEKALALARQEPERRFLARRLEELK